MNPNYSNMYNINNGQKIGQQQQQHGQQEQYSGGMSMSGGGQSGGLQQQDPQYIAIHGSGGTGSGPGTPGFLMGNTMMGNTNNSGSGNNSSRMPGLGGSDGDRRITYIGGAQIPSKYARRPKPKKELKEPSMRTPAAMLYDLCLFSPGSPTPTFTYTEAGPVHDRTFECTITLDTSEAKGVARTKKEAKHDACKNLLIQMNPDVEKFLIIPKSSEKSTMSDSSSNNSATEPDVPGNPVGELNEICLKYQLPVPLYEEVVMEGRPHERTFTVKCSLENGLVQMGKARTKKTAKKISAYGMLQIVQEQIRKEEEEEKESQKKEPKEGDGVEEPDSIVTAIGNLKLTKNVKVKRSSQSGKSGSKGTSKKRTESRHKGVLAEFIKKCQIYAAEEQKDDQNQDPAVTTTTTTVTSEDPIVKLKELSVKNKFTVVYTESEPILEEKKKPVYHCAVSVGMDIDGIVFFMGKSSTQEKAKVAATYEVLNFLSHFGKRAQVISTL